MSAWIVGTPSLIWTTAARLTADSRPQLVFIGELARPDDAAHEAAVFGFPRMQLAARVFRRVSISRADAARDPTLSQYVADAPVLLVATPDATRAFALRGTTLTAVDALEKMSTVTAEVSSDNLPAIVTAAERTQAAIAAVDEELRRFGLMSMTEADRRAGVAAATARRDALVVQFRSQFVLHARTIARS